MFAIIETSGKQYKVEKGQEITVDRLEDKEGATVTIDKVLLINSNNDTKIGMPWIEGACVEAKVLAHPRGEKLRVFKMIAKKRHSKTIGHRADLTTLEITEIKETGAAKRVAVTKTVETKAETPKTTEKKVAAKKTTVKKAPVKKVSNQTSISA